MEDLVPIVIPRQLKKRFDQAWKRCRVLFFSAPCGCGKTAMVKKLLSGVPTCQRSGEDPGCLKTPIPKKCQVLLLDDFQALQEPENQKILCDLMRSEAQNHVVLVSRGSVPGWLLPFQFAGVMETFEMKSLFLDREAVQRLLEAYGVGKLTEGVVTTILRETKGYPAALAIFCRRLGTGAPLDEAMRGAVRYELYAYFDEMVYRRLEESLRQLILDVAPFEEFGGVLASMVSGDSEAAARLDRLRRKTSMFFALGPDRFQFYPFFRQFVRWEMEQELSPEACRAIFSRAGLHYELKGELAPALECYVQAREHSRISQLLVRNAQQHPGIAQYYELERYYFALPREEILRSPELMAGMSMLCALSMDYEQSDLWYDALKTYAAKIKRRDAEYGTVQGRLVYLDIALPHRGITGLTQLIPTVFRLIREKEVQRPSLAVTGGQPSIMNGGKDFSQWSKKDDLHYATLAKPLEVVLGADGVGLADCGLCESKFEKDGNYESCLLTLMARLGEIQRLGTPDIEFAAIGLLARVQLAQGKARGALESIQSLRKKFEEKGESRFLPNMDAMLCRIHLFLGELQEAVTWLDTGAPKEDFRLWPMFRYRYITRALVQLQLGDFHGALLVSRLLPYTARCSRILDAIHIHVILAIAYYRLGDPAWQSEFCTALDSAGEFRFIRPVAEYGVAVLPLLTSCGWEGDRSYLRHLTLAARTQAANYPSYLQPSLGLSAPLTPTETQVMKLLCHNKSNREICEILSIALPTAKTHVRSILEKLCVSRRTEVRDAAERLHLFP